MDVDIDLPPGTDIRKIFPSGIPASLVTDRELAKHPCGVYFENMSVDPLTGLAAIPHRVAAEIGFTKIDFLHLNLLSNFKSKCELRRAALTEPDWSLLQDSAIVSTLFQISKHFALIQQIKPKSVIELSDLIALIRPDKRQLLGQYLKDRNKVRSLLYRSGDDDKSAFRKGHSLSYAHTIVAQLNRITQQVAMN